MKPDKSQGKSIYWRKNLSDFERKTQFLKPVDALPPRRFQCVFLQYVNIDQFSIHALCRVLNVNRSTYYHHAFRSPDQTQLQIQDSILKPLIKGIFTKSCGRFGARKIRIKLIEQGHTVSERRILRLMKECGLSSSHSKPRLNSANDRQYQYYPNKLKRNFLTDAPNKIWVSDITYAKVGMDFLYLCVEIDLYSRKVVSYSISEFIDTTLIKQAFLDALRMRGFPNSLVFHSDQGTQYTSFEFRDLLEQYNVTQSFSAPGSPHDNAVAESFFATIKGSSNFVVVRVVLNGHFCLPPFLF